MAGRFNKFPRTDAVGATLLAESDRPVTTIDRLATFDRLRQVCTAEPRDIGVAASSLDTGKILTVGHVRGRGDLGLAQLLLVAILDELGGDVGVLGLSECLTPSFLGHHRVILQLLERLVLLQIFDKLHVILQRVNFSLMPRTFLGAML